jgi:hypothetical protein
VTATAFTRNACVVRFSRLALAAAALLIAGCGGSGSNTSSAPKPQRDGVPMIDFRVTGGIAGVHQELMVNSSGASSVRTHYRKGVSTEHFRLSRAEVAALADKLVAARIETLPKSPPSGCSDCFEYAIGLGDSPYRTDQVSVPKRLQPLIAACSKLVSRHTSGDVVSISSK